MPTDFAFRFTIYLSLALACACLGYAEWDYLPEVSVFTGVVAVALVASFRAEGRFALSLRAANLVGGILALVAVGWIAHHWRHDQSLIHTLPWPAGLLPYLGPVVMGVLAAKLFRPKHVGDWWVMQGLGLAGVGLAASLTEDAVFVALLGLYAVAGVASLSLFYHRRAAGLIPPVPPADPRPGPLDLAAWFPWLFGRGTAAPVVAGPPPDRIAPAARFAQPQVAKALGWLGVAGLVALPLFFATPRANETPWRLNRARGEVGYAPEGPVDLTRSGSLQPSREMAFEVTARDAAGKPVDDLPLDQRWRGVHYIDYSNGRWQKASWLYLINSPLFALGSPGGLPDFGPGETVLTFRLAPRVRGFVLADPVYYEPGKSTPVVHEHQGQTVNGMQLGDGTFIPLPSMASRATKYRQVYRPPAEPGLGVPFTRAIRRSVAEDPFAPLLATPPREVSRWTLRLFNRLVREGKLPPGVLERSDPIKEAVDPADYRAVAEVFRDYLSDGTQFKYSLTHVRGNPAIDPVEDFLLNTRTGHCERFATALVLMLRAVGVPAQFVLGFKGCEPLGEGRYVVRQEQAHAWAEALIPAAGPPGERWQWLSLDPSPSTGADPEAGDSGLFDSARQSGQRFFADYIVGLTAESQRQLADSAGKTITAEGPRVGVGCGMLAVLAVTTVLVRRRLSRPPAPPAVAATDPVPWFTRLAAVLGARGIGPTPGETPAEYAARAAGVLGRDPALSAAAGVPGRVAAAVYEARYAGRPLPADRVAELEREIDRLAALPAGAGTEGAWAPHPRG